MPDIKIITEQDLSPLDEPGDGWFMIEAAGEYPVTLDDGKEIIQVLDREAIEAIVSNFSGELLTDKDHLSRSQENGTESYSWVKELAGLDDGHGGLHLAARQEFTDLGRPLIEGKIYKNWSTEYSLEGLKRIGGNRYRPTELVGLALTNRPRNAGQRPITNREPSKQQQTNTMQAIAEKLGLSPEATEEEILNAIQVLQDAQVAAQDAEADAILNSEGLEGIPEEEKELLKDGLITNRERTLKVIKNRKEELRRATPGKTPVGRIHNRAAAPAGGFPLGGTRSAERTIAQSHVARAMEIIRINPGIGYFNALTMAQTGK